MTPAEAIRSALLRVAANVAKHTIQRDGCAPDDACFVADLRESEAELAAAIEQAVADERERAARIVTAFHDTETARSLAARIRAGG